MSTDPPPPTPPTWPSAPPPGPDPQPGHGNAPPYAQSPDDRPQSRLAIVAFVLGLLAFILPAVICGLIALRRIKDRNQRGRGFAIAGLVLSALWTLVIAAIIVVALSTDAERDASGRITEAGSLNIFDVRDGDCLNGVEKLEEAMSVDAVPCSEPHDAQVYAVTQLPGREYPGDDAIARQAEGTCQRGFPAGAGEDAEMFFFQPSRQSWDTQDDRAVACMALFKPRRTGSLRE